MSLLAINDQACRVCARAVANVNPVLKFIVCADCQADSEPKVQYELPLRNLGLIRTLDKDVKRSSSFVLRFATQILGMQISRMLPKVKLIAALPVSTTQRILTGLDANYVLCKMLAIRHNLNRKAISLSRSFAINYKSMKSFVHTRSLHSFSHFKCKVDADKGSELLLVALVLRERLVEKILIDMLQMKGVSSIRVLALYRVKEQILDKSVLN